MMESAKTILLKLWSDQDIQVMVLISLTVQLFLLFTGNLRRRRISGLLRLMIWFAYVGADVVAVFAIGLLCKYKEKYNLRSSHLSESQTLPFLWAPFLLLHLGGQDTITAFSMEDNNLWLRHLLNLVVQVTLTLYVFWNSFDILDIQLLAVAVPIFVAGLIKYGERTWALYSRSRDYLSSCDGEVEEPLRNYKSTSCGDVVACYALNTVLLGHGLLVGRTLFHIGEKISKELVDDFEEHLQKLNIVMMKLNMMYDLLYTKAMVLQSWTGRILRYIADVSMLISVFLFLANNQLNGHNRADVVITYILFVGAMFMEAYSVSMVIVSPWTRARSTKGTFLCWLSYIAGSLSNATMLDETIDLQQLQPLSSFSMGQFNLADCYMSERCTPKLISKVVGALGLEKKWKNFWHIQHVEDKTIGDYIEKFLWYGQGSEMLENARELNHVLNLEFEHAIFRLHISTDLHLSNDFNDCVNNGRGHSEPNEMAVLAAECRKLSNYFMYLMAVHPCMLPVSNAAQDLEHFFAQCVRDECSGTMSKYGFLKKYANEKFKDGVTPFNLLPPSVVSLRAIKEVWVRLLIYAAGKCPGDVIARQLSNGSELLTSLWMLMLHYDVGDVGTREINLLESTDPDVTLSRWCTADLNCYVHRLEGPLNALEIPAPHAAADTWTHTLILFQGYVLGDVSGS